MTGGLVVVGASLAGLRAVETARRAGYSGPITLVGAEEHLPYDRPPLSKAFLDAGGPADPTTFRPSAYLSDELGVTLRLGTRATALDVDEHVVHVDDGALPFESVLLATGSRPRTLPFGHELAGVHVLRTCDDALAIRRALDSGARTVVIGAGFIGSEIAASARKRGLDVTVLEALATPLVRAAGNYLGPAIAALHERNGTALRLGTSVTGIRGTDRVEAVTLADGSELPADLVVVGIGAAPVTDWLDGSGLTVEDGVVCDETLRAADGVYAAGDIARWPNPLFGATMRLEHWTNATEQAVAAVRNLLDPGNAKPHASVPYFWSDWYDSRIQFVGIPSADEVAVVHGDASTDRRWLAVYRRGDRVVGALAVNGQNLIMKYRALIARSATWAEALEFAAAR